MPGRYVFPLDPECPDVLDYCEMADDPYMRMSGCWGEFYADFSAKHRRECARCLDYSLENVDIEY